MAGKIAVQASRLDKLYEFDREPVSPDKLQSGGKFAGLFAGEHVAATEFVIGAFFVLHGVTAKDLIYGLLLGNLLAVLPSLGVRSDFANVWDVAKTKVWNGIAAPGQDQFGFWHILFFAWFCNLAMHIGLSDLAIFRYAKKWTYGLYTAFGMYPGHMLAWICSGIMVVAVGRQMNPALMAFEAAGFAGVAGVLFVGWTTANPTLYRAGLALQAVTPNWPRWKITLAAGTLTTVISCFPVVFVKLLDYVAIYGLVLMPIGAVVFAEHWVLPLFSMEQYRAEKFGWMINGRALAVWIGTLVICFFLPIHLYFRWLPGYFIALVSYVLLQAIKKNNR